MQPNYCVMSHLGSHMSSFSQVVIHPEAALQQKMIPRRDMQVTQRFVMCV